MGTAGSASSLEKRAGGNTGTALQADSTDLPKHAAPVLKLALLFDVRLERRFAPVLVRWLYVGSLVLIGAMTLFGLLMSWWLASWAGWGFWIGVPISTAGGLVWALGARLACEQLIRWTGPQRSYTAGSSFGSSPAPSSHPSGSGPGSMGGGGAPRWKNDLHP
jgi:hypothetical protein